MIKLTLAGLLGLCLLWPGVSMADADTPPGTAWQVSAVGEMDLSAEDDATLQFADGRIWGRSGCNRYSGGVTLTAETPASGALVLGPVMSTRMACPGRADQIETAFLAALEVVTGYQIGPDGMLTLTAAGAPVIRARPN
jgi:heat shock protein HslJ